MERSDYTDKERIHIYVAYALLDALSERMMIGDNAQLDHALKGEKESTHNLITAKALVIKAFLEGYKTPEIPLLKVASFRLSYLEALLFGVRVYKSQLVEEYVDETFLVKLQEAIDAHTEARERWFNNMQNVAVGVGEQTT